MKTVDLREKGGGLEAVRAFSRRLSPRRDKGTEQRLEKGWSCWRVRLGEVTRVCVWTGMIQESGSN